MERGAQVVRIATQCTEADVSEEHFEIAKKLGMETVVNLIYSVSPRHTDEYYARKAREAAAMRPYRICFKDVGGMLTPERTQTLVRLIRQNVGDTTLEFHAHCNNGLALKFIPLRGA